MKLIALICPYLAWMAKIFTLTLWLCGCGSSSAIDITSARNAAGAIVAVVDSVNDHYQPALPNDLEHFGQVIGTAPEPKPAAALPVQDFVIHVIPKCGYCTDAELTLKDHFSGVKSVEYTDQSQYPQWIRDLLAKDRKAGFPFIEWHVGKSWYHVVGWPGWEKFNARYEKTLAKPAKATARKPRGAIYADPTGRHWSWQGDLREHLLRDHGIDSSGMSAEEAMQAHDRAHEGHASAAELRTRDRSGRRSKPVRGLRFSLACPFCGGA